MKILIPLDGSELALTALTAAEELARAEEIELLLLAVGEVPETSSNAKSAPDAESTRKALARLLEEAATRVSGVLVRARVEIAEDAASAIERVAEDEEVDLILMTTHGRSGMSPLAHGHVADAVLRGGRAPVRLVCPSHEAGEDPVALGADPDANGPPAQAEPAGASPTPIRLSLLGVLGLSNRGEPIGLCRGTQRLLAFLALQRRAIARDVIAEALWPEASEAHLHGRLRSAIWRIEEPAREVILIDDQELALSPEVDLDFRDATALAHRILFQDTIPPEGNVTAAAIAMLSSDLLADWHEDWVIVEQENWRQLRLHALEALARELLDAGRHMEALEAASEAKQVDPLRESPYVLAVRIHVAEGNLSEAVKEFLVFRQLLKNELGIEPTPQLRELMSGLMP